MDSKNIFFISLVLILTSIPIQAQEKRETRDIQFKLYNNLYTQEAQFNSIGNKINQRDRQTFLTSILETTFLSEKKVLLGFDIYFRASKVHGPDDSPSQVFRFENNRMNAYSSLAFIGPKLIWHPLKDKNFFLKGVFLIPVNAQTEIPSDVVTIDNSGYQFWAQAAYNLKVLDGLYAFFEVTSITRFNRNRAPTNDIFVPIKVFITYFPAEWLGIFSYNDYTPTITDPTAHYWQIGGGIKLFPSKRTEVELSATEFISGKNSGAGYTINLGLGYKLTYGTGSN